MPRALTGRCRAALNLLLVLGESSEVLVVDTLDGIWNQLESYINTSYKLLNDFGIADSSPEFQSL